MLLLLYFPVLNYNTVLLENAFSPLAYLENFAVEKTHLDITLIIHEPL